MPMTLVEPRAVTWTDPPDGRSWRVATSWRAPPQIRGQAVGEMSDARARKLHVDLYGPSTAECVIDGRSGQAAAVQELSQDLLLYRWNPVTAAYQIYFRGPIGRTQDTISATTHTVNIAASDYRAMLARVFPAAPYTFTATDQGQLAKFFLRAMAAYDNAPPSGDLNYNLGLVWQGVLNPDGSYRSDNVTGVVRDRTYQGSENVAQIVDDLAACINGFEWGLDPVDPLTAGSVQPNSLQTCTAAVYYPNRGVTRTFVAEYGSSVASLTRTVQSSDFANWVAFYGQATNPANPLKALSMGPYWADIANNQAGNWQAFQSQPSITVQATLQEQADGYIALHSQLVPAYTLVLMPRAWVQRSDCWLGDTIALRIRSGRLAVNTTVRIVGMDFDIDDNGVERISLAVGRPFTNLGDVLNRTQTRLDNLTRR
jgi:hypothetical protein